MIPDKKFICLAATGTSMIWTLAALHRRARAAGLGSTGSRVVESTSPAPRGFPSKAAAGHPLPWRGSSIPKLPTERGDWEIRRRGIDNPQGFLDKPCFGVQALAQSQALACALLWLWRLRGSLCLHTWSVHLSTSLHTRLPSRHSHF